jgi:hypothetical protein
MIIADPRRDDEIESGNLTSRRETKPRLCTCSSMTIFARRFFGTPMIVGGQRALDATAS